MMIRANSAALERTLTTVLCAIPFLLAAASAPGQVRITVDAGHPGPTLSPTQHGIFFEEINHAGEGGLYGQMLLNPYLQDGQAGWRVKTDDGATAEFFAPGTDGHYPEPHFRIMTPATAGNPTVTLTNGGHFGIGVRKGERLDVSLLIGEHSGSARLEPFVARLVAPNGDILANAPLERDLAHPAVARGVADAEVHLVGTLTARATEPKASFQIFFPSSCSFLGGTLFLEGTYHNRPRSLRKDLAGMVAGMRPSFVRFPGGCFVEGNCLANRFNWKETLGDPRGRKPTADLWGYTTTNGLGFHEYLTWCEDMHAEPLFVVNCGMSHTDVVPIDKMDEYVRSALDAIEYANGDNTTKWGKLRAANGHPKPFHLRFMEIGNENGGPRYEERYALFYNAIKKAHPEITLIANEPVHSRQMDMVDEHYYSSPQFFARQAHRYDTYPRNGPKIYVGEYAVTEGCGRGNLMAALGEAMFITGMERNCDVVRMSSYAPLFVNVNDRKWNPDAIVFDTLHCYGTPSYWAQRMFSTHRGDSVLPSTCEAPKQTTGARGAIALGTWNTTAEFKDIRVEVGGKTVWTGDSTQFPLKPTLGQWQIDGGDARQDSLLTDCRAVGGDPSWTDYTLTLKARKLSGSEGFLIHFHVRGQDDYFRWNIGGWGNRWHNLQCADGGGAATIADNVDSRLEPNRWYDIRIELAGSLIRCRLDGELIHDVTYDSSPPQIGVVATRDTRQGAILLKMVNLASSPQEARITLNGAGSVSPDGEAVELTSAQPTDENSLAAPERVVPRTHAVHGIAPHFTYTLPAYSATILKIRARPAEARADARHGPILFAGGEGRADATGVPRPAP
jgi:alpha-L-arabinofuranosidase